LKAPKGILPSFFWFLEGSTISTFHIWVGLIFGGVTFAIIYIFEGPLSHFVFFMKERGEQGTEKEI
jgi:hypothetical protein